MRSRSGYSFVELLVGLSVSTILIFFWMTQYMSSRIAQHKLQETVNQAMEVDWLRSVIHSKLQMAGYTPCANVDQLISMDHSSGGLVHGLSYQNDFLMIHTMRSPIQSAKWLESENRFILSRPFVGSARQVIVTDCLHAEVYDRDQLLISSMSIRTKQPLRFVYKQPVYIGDWQSDRFFIRHHGLFYASDRVDELSRRVQHLTVQRLAPHLVEIQLDFPHDDPVRFAVSLF